MRTKPCVGIIMGSDSDLFVMQSSTNLLKSFDVDYDITILSAHRTPKRVLEYGLSAADRFDVIIAGAGAAAHLPGVVASYTIVPVIGVPLDSSPLRGVDSLYAIVQMPSGIPVATMAIGQAGAKNAAIYALQIIATKYDYVKDKLNSYRKDMDRVILEKNKELDKLGAAGYLQKHS